ncbi:uncharacterized protein V1516DRAFT_678683 [Lipomyces oligophaga]|uniref:uncharacterized protein n=1 Tax=Lipomyces oligophaga TaxID=45792 RepID=UPI0034CF7876
MDETVFVLKQLQSKYPTLIYDVEPLFFDSVQKEVGMVFLIPGNPGLPTYYVPFLSMIREKLPGWRIVCVSQAGCDVVTTKLKYADPQNIVCYGLHDQVSHKLEALVSLSRLHGYFGTEGADKQVVLVGHSIGCWMIQHLILQLRQQSYPINVSQSILLFPTIKDISKSSNGVKFLALERKIPLAILASSFAFYFTRYFPDFVVNWAIKLVMRSPPIHALQATRSLVSSQSVVYQCLSLAGEEMEYVKAETEDLDTIFWSGNWSASTNRSGPGKIVAFFANKDHWIADSTRAELLAAHSSLDNVELHVASADEKCSHSFCVKESKFVADKVVGWIKSSA